MKANKVLLTAICAAVCSGSVAQSSGERFDAAMVAVPGMAIQRGGFTHLGDWTTALLQHGDVIMTANFATGPFHILTSDGTVIGVFPATTIVIDARQIGFDVFRVVRGGAEILGNINNGYPVPVEFVSTPGGASFYARPPGLLFPVGIAGGTIVL